VILSRDGDVQAVLVDIGGFLGMGERQVAVDMDAIKFVSDGSTGDQPDDFFLVMNAVRTDFEAAPDYSMAPGMDTTGMTAEATGDVPADGTVTTDVPADGTVADATDAPADGVVADAPADDLAATSDPAMDAPLARDPVMREGYSPADAEYLTAERLTGARVYDTNDEWIGDVGDLILAEDGQVTDAVIDVGGFLGIGEKPVALKLTDIDILRDEAGNDVRVYVSMTKDQLEELPRFDG
jgi:sporulation protein YlmC with PRC-barrel domain